MVKYRKTYEIYRDSNGEYNMRLLISGSRGITDFDLAPYIPSDTDTIICGGASGIDRLAEEYADTHHLSKMILHPQYRRFGRAAPLKRNEEMVEMADAVLIIWDGKSKGTRYTMELARKTGHEIQVVTVSGEMTLSEDE